MAIIARALALLAAIKKYSTSLLCVEILRVEPNAVRKCPLIRLTTLINPEIEEIVRTYAWFSTLCRIFPPN